jgi:hypothetical protein
VQTADRPSLVPQSAAVHCERHRPEQTTQYRLVQQNAATLITETAAAAGAETAQRSLIVRVDP